MPTKKNINPIIEIYKGFQVRKLQNRVGISVGPDKYKRLIDLSEENKISICHIIEVSSTPCSNCKGLSVITMNSVDEFIEIPRGLISKQKNLQHSGPSKFKTAK